MNDLDAMMESAARALPVSAVRMLDAMGLPRAVSAALTAAWDIGLMRVAVGKDGLFEPEGPEPRLILPVREHGVTIDLVALSSARPDDWACLTGAGWTLGHAAFADARDGFSSALRLHARPIEWLVSGCAGICVLDWSAEALGWLRGLGPGVTIQCDDAGAARALHGLLARGGLPRVAVAELQDDRQAA